MNTHRDDGPLTLALAAGEIVVPSVSGVVPVRALRA
jgi:hypothetical protein